MLDSSKGWKIVETIPLSIGSRHFRVTSMSELLDLPIDSSGVDISRNASNPSLGDRVVVSVPQQELTEMRNATPAGERSPFDAKIKALRKLGAKVEIREVRSMVTEAMENPFESNDAFGVIEDMTPNDIMESFLNGEVNRGSLSNNTASQLLEVGSALLDEVLNSENATSSSLLQSASPGSSKVTEIDFHSVTIEGYGSFKDAVTYPLMDRGLVLIRGSNLDGGYDR